MGTAAYGILIGLCAGIGLLFLTLALRRGRVVSIELLVCALSLTAACQTLATLRMHSSSTTEEYAEILHGSFSYFGIATLIAVTWIVGLRTELWYPRVPLALTGVGLISITLNALGPGALIADEVTELRDVSLFGETFVVHTPSRSSLQLLLFGYLLAITAYITVGLAIRLRRGARRLDPLLIGIAGAWILNVYDVLVDEAVVNTSYLAPFGLVAFIAGLAVEHADQIMTTKRQLTNQSMTLETIVASRTDALRIAHDDLIKQLDNQNRSALRLAELSELFLYLGGVSAADENLDEVLGEALGVLGPMVDASNAEVSWQISNRAGDETAKKIEWKRQGIETATSQEPVTIERTLQSGETVVGQLTVTQNHGRPFPGEFRRLVDLAAQFLGGFLVRLQLESSHVNSAVESERQRIAQELHDSLSQRLYAAAFNAEAVSLAARSDVDFAARGAAKIRTLVLSTLAEIRILLFDLQPDSLSTQRLPDLLAQLCTSVAEIYQRPVDLVVVQNERVIPTQPKLALYRIVQESLSNALRHSDGQKFIVTVDIAADGATIQVADDGVGFDPTSARSGHGLRNMRARAAEIGATLDLASHPTTGTSVSVTWPRHRRNLPLELTDVRNLEVSD